MGPDHVKLSELLSYRVLHSTIKQDQLVTESYIKRMDGIEDESKLTQMHLLEKNIHFLETQELPCIALPRHEDKDAHKHHRLSQHTMAQEH